MCVGYVNFFLSPFVIDVFARRHDEKIGSLRLKYNIFPLSQNFDRDMGSLSFRLNTGMHSKISLRVIV